MSTVVLIRAGFTDYDESHRLLGTLDVPVNRRGQEQIREITRQLHEQGIRPQAILTPPENPAACTAHAIADTFPGTKVQQLDELRNVNQGLWQGLPESDVRKRFPRFFRSGKEDPVAICPPEGETLLDACKRLQRILSRAMRKYNVFAIVVPEPLTTVIRCTIQHRRPRMTECLCGESCAEMMQILQSDCFEPSGIVAVTETALAAYSAAVHESPDP